MEHSCPQPMRPSVLDVRLLSQAVRASLPPSAQGAEAAPGPHPGHDSTVHSSPQGEALVWSPRMGWKQWDAVESSVASVDR